MTDRARFIIACPSEAAGARRDARNAMGLSWRAGRAEPWICRRACSHPLTA